MQGMVFEGLSAWCCTRRFIVRENSAQQEALTGRGLLFVKADSVLRRA